MFYTATSIADRAVVGRHLPRDRHEQQPAHRGLALQWKLCFHNSLRAGLLVPAGTGRTDRHNTPGLLEDQLDALDLGLPLPKLHL
jgi:hypothetical protein